MSINGNRVIFHIDVNSAYLSWSAVDMLLHGSELDIRTIPSAVGGDPVSRHGIILAKSIPAKKFKIKTGESLYAAYEKCPNLYVVPPKYELYVRCSNSLADIFNQYTPTIQRFSIDESFLDFTGMEHLYPDPIELAYKIKDRIKKELGFTVSIGVSNNKLLAKVASDIKKPDAVTTLFTEEIEEKMWPLSVEDLFMVGRATTEKLHMMNIFTIGDLANYNLDTLKQRLKSHGAMIWNFANGVEVSQVRKSSRVVMKGIGNSTTVPFDVEDEYTAHLVILSLTESVAMRLRDSQNLCRLVEVSYLNKDFYGFSRQHKLSFCTDSTKKIAEIATKLFMALWRGEPVRKIGVRVSELCTNEFAQATLFDDKDIEKQRRLDNVIDDIRVKFGGKLLVRASFMNTGVRELSMGMGDGEEGYPLMGSIL